MKKCNTKGLCRWAKERPSKSKERVLTITKTGREQGRKCKLKLSKAKDKILVIAAFAMIITVAVRGALNIGLIPIYNLVLLAGLIAVTTIYARSTLQIARYTKEQAKEVREQRITASRPVIVQRATQKIIDAEEMITSDYFSHFEIYNAGNGPAIELETSLLNKERTPIHSKRKTFLRAGEPPIIFYPSELASLEESTFYLVCEYQSILSGESQQTWYQTWLPFRTAKASKEGQIYVIPGELEFREASEKDRIDAFSSKSKPK